MRVVKYLRRKERSRSSFENEFRVCETHDSRLNRARASDFASDAHAPCGPELFSTVYSASILEYRGIQK